jgi:hypothetical protein
MFKLAELFVDIKAKDENLKVQVGQVQKQLSAMGVAIGTAVGHLAASAIASATAALTGFLTKGITGAANLGESLSKVSAVFGDSAGAITAVADELAKKFGLSKQSILDAGAAIGLVGKAAGQSQSQAAQLGANMAKLAADASSFYNVPLDEALNKIRSGLVGEAEPLRAFGVLLSEEKVAAEAVALGLAKSTKAVDDQAKVMARASLIQKGLADAQGDLARTADSTSNQWRKFTGTIENTATAIGTALAPAINTIVNAFGDMATMVSSWVESSKAQIESWATGVSNAIKGIPNAWDTFKAGLTVAVLKVEEWYTNAVEIFHTFMGNLGIIGQWIGRNWKQMIVDALVAIGTGFNNLGTNLYNLGAAIIEFLKDPTKGFQFNWKPLLEGFKAETSKLPELLKPKLTSMDDAIAIVGEDLNRKITDRAKAAEGAAKQAAATAKVTAAAAGKKTEDFHSTTSGLAEFASKLRENILSKADDLPKKQLDEAKKTREATEQTRDILKKGIPAVLS